MTDGNFPAKRLSLLVTLRPVSPSMDPKSPSTPSEPESGPLSKDVSPHAKAGETTTHEEDLGFVFEEDEAMLLRYRRLKRRLLFSTIFSVGVVIFALGMMISMWGDLMYWLQDDAAPQEVALVDALDKGGSLEPYLDKFVALSATPDASTAVKISLGREGQVTEKLRFFRLLESGNRVFVQTDAPLGQSDDAEIKIGGLQTKKLPGRFVGRVHRLGAVRFYESLRDHYNALARPKFLTIPQAQWEKLGENNLGKTLRVQGASGETEQSVTLEDADAFEVVAMASEWMVQLGTKTWPKEADAMARIKSIGLPFVHIPYKATPLAGSNNPEKVVQGVQKQLIHRFLVRPDNRSKAELLAQLHAGLDVPANNDSLEIGAAVLNRRRIYSAKIQDLRVSADKVSFLPTSKLTRLGYELEGDRLVPRALEQGWLNLPRQEVQEIRVKRPVMATEDSLILLTDNPPSAQWPAALAFGILGLFVIGNVIMGRRFYSRYRELSEEDEASSH